MSNVIYSNPILTQREIDEQIRQAQIQQTQAQQAQAQQSQTWNGWWIWLIIIIVVIIIVVGLIVYLSSKPTEIKMYTRDPIWNDPEYSHLLRD